MKMRRWRVEHRERARSVLECGRPLPLFTAGGRAGSPQPAAARWGHRALPFWPWSFYFCLLLSALWLRAWGQSYSIDWSTIDGGGGTSTGGVYSISGTIGQPDASQQTMTGGNFSLVGGFWSLFAVVQTPGAPYPRITLTTTNTVVVWWALPDTGWKLQATTNLVSTGTVWLDCPPPYSTNATSLYYLESPPTGIKLFRLHKP
jgi:hypothetical protein